MRRVHLSLRNVVAIASAVALAAFGALGAGASTTAEGTFAFASDYTSAVTKSKSMELSQFTYKGPLAGVGVDRGTVWTSSNGSFRGSGTEYCAACTLDGKSGAFIASYTYAGSGVTYHGTLTITRAFGKLARLRGGGTFAGNVKTNANTYSYSFTLP